MGRLFDGLQRAAGYHLFLLRHVRWQIVPRVVNMHKRSINVRHALWLHVSNNPLSILLQGPNELT
jgi:hypothetical protein